MAFDTALNVGRSEKTGCLIDPNGLTSHDVNIMIGEKRSLVSTFAQAVTRWMTSACSVVQVPRMLASFMVAWVINFVATPALKNSGKSKQGVRSADAK